MPATACCRVPTIASGKGPFLGGLLANPLGGEAGLSTSPASRKGLFWFVRSRSCESRSGGLFIGEFTPWRKGLFVGGLMDKPGSSRLSAGVEDRLASVRARAVSLGPSNRSRRVERVDHAAPQRSTARSAADTKQSSDQGARSGAIGVPGIPGMPAGWACTTDIIDTCVARLREARFCLQSSCADCCKPVTIRKQLVLASDREQ